ncbi:MAG TPA: tRNA (5-methylaminomethyl-2-thiouridine)(34)-methyltransferase MnmD [Cyclobacteriaceae bacterium]|jgi:tRNA U34 5-methylaminomethyl-2-thiouridine-forming methyltransferase MnmC
MDPEIIVTGDGSHSLYHATINETYHSRHGALAESQHVFIQHGLAYASPSNEPVRVLEVGFGTGLNALLTWQHARAMNQPVHYTGIERFPLSEQIWRKLNYGTSLNAEREFTTLHTVSWNEPHALDQHFRFLKRDLGIEDFVSGDSLYDVVYYDAFAPEKQPEMWTSQTLSVVVNALRPGGILVTYCAKGRFRRDLRGLGMDVQSLAGPPGKREMTRAQKT